MRKGEELITCMGVEDLSPEQDKTIGGYCIQDVDLTYAAYKCFILEFPASEKTVIDSTIRMFTEPTLHVDKEKLQQYYRIKKITHFKKLRQQQYGFVTFLNTQSLKIPILFLATLKAMII